MTCALSVDVDEVTEAVPTLGQREDGAHAIVDDLIEINLGAEQDLRPTFINFLLSLEEGAILEVPQRVLRLLLLELYGNSWT